ncbi:MAG TPA: outer-membrane lipoprotein carrier protein LolA, partial [Pseudolabrys sp.]|nr:outer-membrane lipoprotein carrier protein LolA [Pseudolabrys sp.]
MAATARGATVILIAAACMLGVIVPAAADNVPLPTPAPKGTAQGAAAAAPSAAPAAADSTPPHPGFFPFSFLEKGLHLNQATAFDAKQRALLDRVSAYLSSVQTMVGNFVQVGPDGSRTQGTFYLQKPGKVRFEYNPPSPIELIADGSSVVVRDRNLATQDLYPLSQTPLRYLLADHIDLLR